jgi:hypothetical protein
LTWQETDAKLLEALLLATGGEGGASLQDVLLMGDAVDGLVFSLEELTAGLEKLISVEFILIQKNKLTLSPGFLKNYEAITLSEGVDEDQKPLMKLLQQQELSDEKIAEVRTNVLKKYKIKNQYQAYLEQYG